MPDRLSPSQFQELRHFLEQASGIHVHEGKQFLFETRLGSFMRTENIVDYNDLIRRLHTSHDRSLGARVVDLMTTNETYWFRDRYPFRAFRDKVVPELAAEIRSGRRRSVRLWVAAASTGQEPYSLAMIWLEACRSDPSLSPEMFHIIAADISDRALAQARAGRYDRYAMARGLPRKYRRHYFHSVGRYWQIDSEVKALVEFRKFNLQDPFTSLGKFDIIFCRNVLIYFQEAFKRNLFERFRALLNPPALLFLGASESARLYSRHYRLCTHEQCIYYQAT
ncbi:MAG: CheR family methyltransferase [Candidatus Sumerlaeota bacterium]